jgi:hypothetical protein
MSTSADERRAFRVRALEAVGVEPALIDELLAYGEAPPGEDMPPAELPLPDEPHVEAWLAYEREARETGATETLKRHFAQFRFPVRAGMSGEDAYRRATRKGLFEAAEPFAPGVTFNSPNDIELAVLPTMGGRVPVVVAADRGDFVTLVRAFTERNEPADVPDTMGACMVRGFNNWSRIGTYRRQWAASVDDADDAAWAEEFRRLIPRKALYQDRLIILSRGAYSAVDAGAVGLDPDDWLARSLVIRREHECTHYFTYRCLGSLRSHALDELVADFVGLVRAFGRYSADVALLFLGLEHYPDFRPDGRLENYWTRAKLSGDAMPVVRDLVVRAARTLEQVSDAVSPSAQDLAGVARLTYVLSRLSLEELASADGARLVTSRLRAVSRIG